MLLYLHFSTEWRDSHFPLSLAATIMVPYGHGNKAGAKIKGTLVLVLTCPLISS